MNDAGDASDAPRRYERISYLVPDFPALESASPDARRYASVRDGEIVLRAAGSDAFVALTHGIGADGGWEIDGRGVDPWSPDGRFLFALRFDRRDVLKVPRVLFRGADTTIDWPQQTKAGAPLGTARPHLVPLDGSPPIEIDVGEVADCYFRLFGWSLDGSRVWFGRYRRDMSRVDVFAHELARGEARVVMSETSPTFLTDVSQVVWGRSTGFAPLADGGFLWCSERDGWSRLHRHDADGGVADAITPVGAVVHEIVRVDHEAGVAFVAASEEGERRYDVHLYAAPLRGRSWQRLTEGEGAHDARFERDGAHFVDTWSSPVHPPRVERRRIDGRLVESAAAPIDGAATMAEEIVVLAADGVTPLHGLLMFPPGFDASRRYPLVEMVYGGPQMTATPRRFAGASGGVEPLLCALARDGCLVWVVDGRGTPGRSKAFRDLAYRDFADHVVADHEAALRQLIEMRPCVDGDRVGVFGRSWGGYFALRFLLDAPHLYRAGVAVVPGFDVYGGMLYEPYLGIPQEDDAPYRRADLYARASTLSRPFMMMSGTLDTSTLGDAYRMSMLLTEAGVDHENVVFPEQDHVFAGASAALHDRKLLAFFRRELRR